MAAETTMRDAPDVRKAKAQFRRHGGNLRMADALRAGVYRRTLYAMRDAGQVEALARGRSVRSDSLFVAPTRWVSPFGCSTGLATTKGNNSCATISRMTSLVSRR